MVLDKIKATFRSNYFWLVVVLLISAGVRVYKVQDKGYFFLDEYYTVILSNYGAYFGEYGQGKRFESNEIASTGKELKTELYAADNSLSGILSTFKKLRDSPRDYSHTNLYYTIFKSSLFGLDSSNLAEVSNRGFLANLILFLIGFFFFYKLAILLFPNQPILVFCALGIAYLSGSSVGNTMFLRPYQLQETLFVIASYQFVKLSMDVYGKRSIINTANFVLISIVSALLLLSGYFSIPYIAFLGFVLVYYFVRQHVKLAEYLFLVGIVLLSLAIVLVVYPNYFYNLGSYRSQEVVGSFSLASFFSNVRGAVMTLYGVLKSHFISIPILLTGLVFVVFAFQKKIKDKQFLRFDTKERITLALVILSFVWVLLVLYSAPFKAVRYIAPVLPILLLAIPLFCSSLSKIKQGILLIMLTLFFLLKTISSQDIYWERVTLPTVYEENVHIPLIVYGVEESWKQPALTPLFDDERKVQFALDVATFGRIVNNHDLVYVVVDGEYYNKDNNKEIYHQSLIDYETVGGELYIAPFFNLFLLKKKQ